MLAFGDAFASCALSTAADQQISVHLALDSTTLATTLHIISPKPRG